MVIYRHRSSVTLACSACSGFRSPPRCTQADHSGQTLLDLTIVVPSSMSVHDSHSIEVDVREAVMLARKEVREVRVHVHGLSPGEDVPSNSSSDRIVRNDFGRDGC